MRSLILSAFLLSAFPLVSMGQVTEGQWTYIVENGGATITASTASGDVTIPSVLGGYAVKKVGKYLPSIFGYSNPSITSIVIPNSVTSIGMGAFLDCSGLTSIIIPNSVTSIGQLAFSNCTNLTSVTIPNSVTSIGVQAFSNTSLTSIIIPNSVTSIGNYAFATCGRLIGTLTIPNSVTSIGMAAFEGCTSLTSIIIPNSVTSIGSSAFGTCTSLTSIIIPNSVTSTGDYAFVNCTSLTSVTIPNSVTSIGNGAFSNTSLTSIIIPNSVTSIGVAAFSDCTALTSITIPESVTSIGYIAFGGCTSLVTAYLPTRFASAYTNFGLTASQVNFGITLTASCLSSEGTILVNPNKIPYEAGESVVVTATPKAGYLFSNWSEASTATTSSITLTMDASKSVTAIFIQDGRDTDGDSLTNYQESITYGTNPNQKDSNLDGVEDGHAVSMGYSPTLNFSALIAHPPTGLYTTSQIQNMAVGDLVLTKNVGGSFTLNYDIEQSTDLQTWTTYAPLSLPITGLPTDKAFVRIKAKQ